MKSVVIGKIVVSEFPPELLRDGVTKAYEASHGDHHALGESVGEAVSRLTEYLIAIRAVEWK